MAWENDKANPGGWVNHDLKQAVTPNAVEEGRRTEKARGAVFERPIYDGYFPPRLMETWYERLYPQGRPAIAVGPITTPVDSRQPSD